MAMNGTVVDEHFCQEIRNQILQEIVKNCYEYGEEFEEKRGYYTEVVILKFGREIKQNCHKSCMIWGYAHGTIGYIVKPEEYGKEHESISSFIPQGKPEEFAKAILSLM